MKKELIIFSLSLSLNFFRGVKAFMLIWPICIMHCQYILFFSGGCISYGNFVSLQFSWGDCYILETSLGIAECMATYHLQPLYLLNYYGIHGLILYFNFHRSIHSIFSTSEVEEFLGIIILFFLDRKLEGLSLSFDECMQSVMSFFTDDEWLTSSRNVANALAYRLLYPLPATTYHNLVTNEWGFSWPVF